MSAELQIEQGSTLFEQKANFHPRRKIEHITAKAPVVNRSSRESLQHVSSNRTYVQRLAVAEGE
jgi:hypothetical protein